MEPDPEDAVGLPEARTGMDPEDDLKLVAKGEVLEGEVTVRAAECEEARRGRKISQSIREDTGGRRLHQPSLVFGSHFAALQHYEEMLGGELSVIGIMALRGVGRRRGRAASRPRFSQPPTASYAPPR
jgi:hypothetical protein